MQPSFPVRNRPVKVRPGALRRKPRIRPSTFVVFLVLGIGVIGFAAFLAFIAALVVTMPGGTR